MVLKPIQLGMLASITVVFGLDLAPKEVTGLVLAVVGKGRVENAGKSLAKQLAKHVPGGNVLNATVAATITGALGEAYIRLCVEALQREAAGKPMPTAEMATFLMDAYGALVRKPADGSKRADDDATSTPDAA